MWKAKPTPKTSMHLPFQRAASMSVMADKSMHVVYEPCRHAPRWPTSSRVACGGWRTSCWRTSGAPPATHRARHARARGHGGVRG
jgi:hypothetical protein